MNVLIVKISTEKNNYWDNTQNTFQTYPRLAIEIARSYEEDIQIYFVQKEGGSWIPYGPIEITKSVKNNGFYRFSVNMFQKTNLALQSNASQFITKFYGSPGFHALKLTQQGTRNFFTPFYISINTPMIDGRVNLEPPSEKNLSSGDSVRVIKGPFASFVGTVEAISDEGKVKLQIIIFGRPTPVELQFSELEKVLTNKAG